MAVPKIPRDASVQIHYADDWAALYVNGMLIPNSVGDSYVAEEIALLGLGVVLVHDNAFMRGRGGRDGVAATLEDVRAYHDKRADAKVRADRLRQQALALVAEADLLDSV